MRILMIVHFTDLPKEPGNNRFKYLADLLSRKHRVKVITTSFSHDKKEPRRKEDIGEAGYEVQLCYEPKYAKNVCIKRFYSHYIFSRNVLKQLQKEEKPDVVYCSVPSLSVAAAAAKYCKKHGIRFILDIQDLWPEAFQMVFRVPIVSEIAFFPLKMLADFVYKSADEVIAVSETYAARAAKVRHSGQPNVVYLGTDLDCFDENCKHNRVTVSDKDSVKLAYCGTLGSSYDITCVMDALVLLREKGYQAPVFHVMGDGPKKDEFEKYASERNINAIFYGRVPYPKMCGILKSCDIAVNPISKGAAQSIINKHADYAMAGLPIVNTQESNEYRNLLREYGCGINCRVDSAAEVAKALQTLILDDDLREKMGNRSRKMAETLFDRAITYQKIVDVIEGKL